MKFNSFQLAIAGFSSLAFALLLGWNLQNKIEHIIPNLAVASFFTTGLICLIFAICSDE